MGTSVSGNVIKISTIQLMKKALQPFKSCNEISDIRAPIPIELLSNTSLVFIEYVA